jgi:glutathione S-transferase
MPLRLVIANKAYSSWSLRPWILLTHFKIPFVELVIPLDLPDTRQRILNVSPNGKCPSLHDGPVTVWESLAIIEYIAEKHRDKPIWPRGKKARAIARSLCSEMHSGFQPLREHCPTNFRRPVRKRELTSAVEADVARIEAAWADARKMHRKDGRFLFGPFSAADAMFAPVVNRLHVYDVPVKKESRDYMEAVMALPAWKAWMKDAEAEPWSIERYDSI